MKAWDVRILNGEGTSWFVSVDVYDGGAVVGHAGIAATTLESALEFVDRVVREGTNEVQD